MRKKYGLQDKYIILGVAFGWGERKGFDDFIRLSGLIDENTRIVMIGLSDRQCRNLPGNVIGLKKTGNAAELAGWYTAADVFFNPTYEDNYPTVNLEAQACGTPVVTYRTGGSAESVPESQVIRVGGYGDILTHLNGLSCKKADFSKEKMLKEYIKLYCSDKPSRHFE